MLPVPHPGPGEVGVPAGNLPAVYFPDAAQSLALTQHLATLAAGAGFAFCALSANRALQGQIKLAHDIAGFARVQSKSLAGVSELAVPPGPARDAMLGTARLGETFAEQLAEAANRYGRAFGHLAFAFPVPDRRG
jgi:hypothetical protein